jgi:hypothetical protein
VRENVTISYRGASYEIGRGPHFYGIWVVGAPQPQPVEWWPETPEGWSSAWARFTGIEAPGTIAAVRAAASGAARPAPSWAPGPGPASQAFGPTGPATQPGPITQDFPAGPAYPPGDPGAQPTMAPTPVGHPAALAAQPGAETAQPTGWPGQPAQAGARAGVQGLAAAGLLVIGVALGIASLFPSYLFGSSLAADASNLWPHVIYLAAWAGSALLILLGGARLRMGALLAAGTSIVTFGLFVADAGQAIAYGSRAEWGAGLVLGLLGWLVCALGSGLAVRLHQAGQPNPGRPQPFAARHLLTVVAALAALGTAITFAPSWDGYTLRAANGASSYVQLGDAFKNPGWVITGDILVMIAVVLTVVLAALWRPVREGAWLLAGAVIPMAAQAISAFIQVGQPTPPAQFGISAGEAQQAGLTITNSLTPAFWLFCAFVLVLMIGCAWLLLSSRATALDTPPQRGQAHYGPAGPGPYSWPHPFTGAPQPAAPSPAQPPQTTENHGLDILGSSATEPDILDSHDSAHNEASLNEPGQNEAGQNEAGQNEACQNEAGQNEPSQNEAGKPDTPEPGSQA